MKSELVVATKNKKKLEEIKEILKGLPIRITSLADYAPTPRIVEDGRTFRENAIKKAVRIARFTRKLTLGEDSDLCVDALEGGPGIYSSRFSGKKKDDVKNNLKLLKLLEGTALLERKAHYLCAVALADEHGLIAVKEGRCAGRIGFELKGHHGFGYDPLFVIPKYKKTFAELGPRIKHSMSHRSRALKKTRQVILSYLRRQS